ncbi:serine hydrolase family protein [Akkermansia glycaniphila]|uniref:RBBP9/YdeN family alpha/beta hydrolase n=1 Tax=Akkermansia glycaniphila TaxID=1679444 RepID=UPI001C01934C|nr:alpha/beta hydrolase [Akkermansia glycaniphila]MBT9449071.1 serine hydrolase family protein [Akkermansia glycaniphila]
MSQGKHIEIVHGYGSAPGRNWFPWLKAELERRGFSADVLQLPDAAAPCLDVWLNCIASHVRNAGCGTFFVAHSLGCISLLGALHRLEAGSRFGGMVLVSGFARPVEGLRELDAFANQEIDFARLAAMSGRTVVIAAGDDPVVPAAATEELAAKLHAEFILCEHGGHFMDSDGFKEWPFLLARIEEVLASSRCRSGT